MLLIIFLVLLLVLVQAQIPGKLLTDQVGAKGQMGSRDDLPRHRLDPVALDPLPKL